MDAVRAIQLFQQIAEGDTEAFKMVFQNYRRELYAAACKLIKDTAIAEEIVQETFIRLWLYRDRLPGVRQPKNYLYRILLNYTSDLLRQEQTRTRIQQVAASLHTQQSTLDTEARVNFLETGRRLKEGIEKLSPQQRTAYELIEQQGLSLDEAAEKMQRSVHTVKSHIQKAREFLRNYLSDIAFISILLVSWK